MMMMKLGSFFVLSALLMASCVYANGVRPRRERVKDLRELRDFLDVQDEDQLIVGGANVVDGTFPWFTRFSNGIYACGGALIASDRVLTSAKCINDLYGSIENANLATIQIGGWDSTNAGEIRQVQCVIVHPSFSDSGAVIVNDIAVAILTSASTKTIIPGSANVNYTNGIDGTNPSWSLIGFGATSAGSTVVSSTLKNVTLPYVALSTCQNSYANALSSGIHFCAGGTSGRGGCNSDQGGILMGINAPNTINQVWTAIGVYSFSSPNCGQGAPDVFTDIAHYASSFIQPALSATCPSTPAPTAAPTCACFSESATVQVKDEALPPSISPFTPPKPVAMKDLQVGQQVFAGHQESVFFGNKRIKNPVYETVYGFGHRNEDKENIFVRITTKDTKEQPLEISGSHLIFVDGKEHPVRADTLALGDMLLHKSPGNDMTTAQRITKIENVVRKGFYQPLTKDGTILVGGLEASAYVSVEEVAPRMVQLGLSFFSEHNGFHWYMAPYRFVCTKVAPQWCVNDYDLEQEGIIHWLAFGKSLLRNGENLPKWLMPLYVALILSLSVAFCGAIMFMDNVLEGDVWSISALLLGIGLYLSMPSQKSGKVAKKAKVE